MKETREIICIVCPIGCQLKVLIEDDKVIKTEGNSCKRGLKYAEEECTNPTRILTTTVKVNNGMFPVAPVRSERALPKSLIKKSMEIINHVDVNAPIFLGDIVIKNILGTGINIISTRNIINKGGMSYEARRICEASEKR